MSVQAIGEIDTEYGFAGSAEVPMVRRVVEHAKLIAEVDLSFPIILGHDGRVVDGMHRIARALFEGRREVAVGPFPRADRAGLLQLTI